MKITLLSFALLAALALSAEPNPPTWDSKFVKILDPNDSGTA